MVHKECRRLQPLLPVAVVELSGQRSTSRALACIVRRSGQGQGEAAHGIATLNSKGEWRGDDGVASWQREGKALRQPQGGLTSSEVPRNKWFRVRGDLCEQERGLARGELKQGRWLAGHHCCAEATPTQWCDLSQQHTYQYSYTYQQISPIS